MSSSLSSRGRRFLVKHPVVVDVGCSCRRRRSRLSSLFSSFSRSKVGDKLTPVSLSSFSSTTVTSSTCRDYSSSSPLKQKRELESNKKKRAAVNESVAVVKESTEPYVDFRESMVQMIVEEELYAWDDLNDLLHRFLSLNSPQHHPLILGAFADIWDGVFSHRVGDLTPAHLMTH